MARSQQTWSKREREKKKQKTQQEKMEKRLERKQNAAGESKSLDDMLAYVDENGNLSSTPPDPMKKRTPVKVEDIMIGVPKQSEVEEEEGPRTGTVTFFNASKGYGFIKDQQTGESIFVHINNLKQEVHENEKVNFTLEKGPRGLSAFNVEPAAK